MKKNFYALAALAAALLLSPSCTDPEPIDNEQSVTVMATLENARQWSAGDEVVINNSKYTITEGGSSTATIENVAKADYYYAAYDIGNGTIDGTTLTFTVPQMQGTAIDVPQPMVASNGNANLSFKNLLGTLRLNISGQGTIRRAVVSCPTTPIAGEGSASLDFSGAPILDIASDGSRSITVDLGEGVVLPAEVELVLPAMSYSGFAVTLYAADDQIMSAKTLSAMDIRRGEVVSAEVEYEPDGEAPIYLTATLEADATGVANSWTAASTLYVNGTPAQLAGGQGTATGEFGPVSTAEVYYASTSSASVNGLSGQTMRVTIPTTQRYAATLSTLNPAVGKSTTNNIELSYLAGVVSVDVVGPHVLRDITLSGVNNRRLSGSGVVDMSTATSRLSLNADASKDVVVDCGTAGVNIEAGATFRFVIPAEEYADGFTLSMTDSNGQSFSTEIAGCTVTRNGITSLGSVAWESAQGDDNNLSKLGCANCYMVHMAGEYTFKTRLVDNTPVNNIAKADWLWVSAVEGQQGNALISDIKYADGTITFTASEHEGNALIAAFDAEGNIVWSWHIWLTDKPETFDYQNNAVPMSNGQTDGYYCMDRNLGATDATALGGYETFGLYYQWGRKDPFIGDITEERTRDTEVGGWKDVVPAFGNSAQRTVCNSAYTQAAWLSVPSSIEIGSIAYATAHPMTFMYADPTGSKSNWLHKDNLGAEKNNILYDVDKSLWRPFQKSNYDPCPVGYQVPRKAMWVALVSENSVYTQYKGFVNTTELGGQVWYPSAGYRGAHPSDCGSLMSVQNENGFVKLWSSEMEAAESAYCFSFSDPTYYAASGANWGYGYNVRCVKAY